MLSWAVVFFIIALIAAIFGFGGIAAATGIAKILFFVFLVLFALSLMMRLSGVPKRKENIYKKREVHMKSIFAVAVVFGLLTLGSGCHRNYYGDDHGYYRHHNHHQEEHSAVLVVR